MEFNDDEIVALLNRLLEKLHQADSNHQGSIVLNIYEKGSLHVDHVDTQNFYGDVCPKSQKEKGNIDAPTLPPLLRTDKAMVLWQKAQDAGYVDANYQPLISRTQAALLADAICGTGSICGAITTWLSPEKERSTFRMN